MMSMTGLVKTLISPRYHPAARKLHRKLDWWLLGQKLYRWLRVLPYRGNEVYCPCCDSHLHRFISYNVWCELEKDVQLYRRLRTFTDIGHNQDLAKSHRLASSI